MDLLLLKNLICILCLAVMSGSAFAGYASAAASSFTKSGSTYSMKAGAGATAANGAYNSSASVNMSGRQVTMPASARFASNAARFAVGAMRLNPAMLVGGALAAWALEEGLQYANNQWNKVGTALNYYYGSTETPWIKEATLLAAANNVCLHFGASNYPGQPPVNQVTSQTETSMGVICAGGASKAVYKFCSNGAQWYTGINCPAGEPMSVPATEADFEVLAVDTLPDAAAQQLYDAGQPVPIEAPILNPAPVDQPLGSPYVDPRTGKTVQPRVRVTPDPTAEDPFRVRIDPYTVEVAPAPAPVPGEPAPLPLEEQPKDPCLENPDRVGCLNTGNPDDVSLDNYSVPFTVNPVSVGGAGACPPDSVLTVHGGQQVTVRLGPICDAAIWLRPLVLALAWFSAAYIIAGAVKES